MKTTLKSFLTSCTVFLAIALCACKKSNFDPYSDNGLPPATQTGANIFACRVNGIPYIAEKSSYTLGSSFSRSNNRDTLRFWGTAGPDSLLSTIGFTIKRKISQGVSYLLNDTTIALVNTLRYNPPCGPTFGYGAGQWNIGSGGTLKITKFGGTYTVPSCCTYGSYDAGAIIAGTFDFVIAVPGCDSIKVTDGRFDINYSSY